MDPDLELLDRWCAGDKTAGNELFQRYFDSIYKFFDNKAYEELDELVQRTFLACLTGRDTFRRQCSFRTYLFTLARNELYHYLQRIHRPGLFVDFGITSMADIKTTPQTRHARHEKHEHLLRALRTLPLEQQLLLELHYWEGMDPGELAEVFDIARTTARTRLHRARNALRDRLEEMARLADLPYPVPPTVEDLDEWARKIHDQLSQEPVISESSG